MASNMSVKNRISMFEQTTPAKTQPDPVPIANRSPRPSDFRKGNDGRPASFGGSWRLDEDDKEAMIPAPNRPNSQNRRSYGQTSSDKQDKPARYSSPFKQEKTSPVVLPQKASFNVPPFKHIQNREQKSRVSVSKVTEQAVESREVSWPTALKAPEKRDGPVTDEAENTEPEQNEQSHAHSSRYMRFVHSKGTPGPMKTFQTGLKGSLEAAKVVMEEEKSSAGSSNASTRSSLSNKELNNIAHRALDLLNGKGNQSASKEKSVPVILPTLRSLNSLPASVATKGTKGSDEQQPANRVSRAGKLSQNLHRSQSPAAERAETPDQSQEGAEKASEQNTTPRKSRAAAVSGGGRRTKTVTNTSHQEARRALLNAAQRKKEKAGLTKKQSETEEEVEPEKEDANQGIPEETNDVAVRLGLKASRALAMKNSTKIGNPPKDQINTAFELSTVGSAISSTLSLDSTKSRRLNHPAFVARSASPKVGTSMSRAFSDSDFQNNKETEPAKPFSEELFSSFRHFNASRTPKEANPTAKGVSFETGRSTPSNSDGRPPQYAPSNNLHLNMADSGTIEGIRMEARSPKTLRDALAQGTTSITQSVDYNAPAPINTSGFHDSIISADGSVSLDSSPFLEQEESLHSTSERNYMNTFHDIERSRFPPQNTLQEVSYLASLSSMSQSMMSTFEDPRRIGVSPASRHFAITASDGTNLLGTEFLPTAMSPGPSMRSTHTAMSPGPSMRSGHSLAQSIISVSPRGDTPQHNPDFDYLTKSPSRLSGVDAEPSEQSNHKKELPEKEHGSDEVQPSEVAPSQVAQEVNGKEEKDKARKDTIMMSHSNCSARSSSPPGFLFKDNEDDSDAILVAPDPAGTSFDVDAYAIPEDLFEDCENESDDDKGPKQGSMSILIHGANTAENKDESGHKDRSVSTKGTVSSISTSLRSGLSSVQNVGSRSISTDLGGSTSGRLGHGIMSPVDGSTSLRTGLSSVQVPPPANEGDEDINGSVSMRTGLSSIQSVKANGAETTASESYIDLSSPRTLSQHHSQHPPQANVQFPETIHEEDEDSALKKRSETPVPVKEESLLSGRSTATTDNSTGRSTSGGSESGSNSGLEGGTTGYEGTTDFDTVTESESGFKPRPTKLKTETFESVSAYDTAFDTALDTALESPVSSKWKTFGLKMPSVIKQVLSKASPRVGNPATPSRQTPTQSGVSKPVEFSSDDEEDIFGGLEETSLEDCGAKNNFGNKPTSKSRTPKTFFSKNAKGDSTPRRSTRSERSSNRKKENSQHMRSVRSERIPIQDIKPVTLKNFKTVPPSPAAATNPNSLYSNDRSGTVVDEYEVLNNVNSDITSSLIGGNGPSTAKKQDRKTTPKKSKGDKNKKNTRDRSKTPEPATSKSKKSKKAKTDKSPKLETPVVPPAEGEPKTKEASGKKPDTSAPENADGEAENAKPLSPKAASASMFMNFDCGIVDTLTTVCHFGSKTTETEAAVPVEDGLSAISNTSSDNLTDLEKRVWNEWDRLNLTAPQKATETTAKDEEHDRKREVARGKLLEIANSAISSQMTAKDEDEEQEQQPVESSDYTCSSGSIETGEEGESSGGSGSGSSGVSGSSSEDHTASASASSYYSGTDSEFVSEFPSAPKPTKQPAATPMLLSFSQRSLIEKFSNQLSTDGIEVLKLNHRKKWQVRYFTVSREVIALTAHEAKSQSGDVAQCPKALLWMKKFNAKNGGYGISNIDKQGHGGMMLIDLTDVHVVEKEGDEIPLPKNLIKKFKNSVLIKLEHTIKGEKRSIGFRCKNNDEAQFLCTCMRVIRDLLKRERSMRKKSTNKI